MPIDDTKAIPDPPSYGMDYGVPPRFMLMANPALMELWNQAKCIGLGYLQLPKYGSLTDVPCVGVVFDDMEKGIRVFDLLQSWDCEPGSGRGTDISFIKDEANNSYTMTVSTNIPEMIRRLLEPSMTEDYSLMTMGLSVRKTVSLSKKFDWLRSQSKSKPIIFVPADVRDIAPMDYALAKGDIQFFDKNNVPVDSIEHAILSTDEEEKHWENPTPPVVDPAQVSAKRKLQLDKFFPIALSRLEHNPTFLRAVEQLKRKRERWQVVQAACNLLCIERFPNFRTELGKLDFHKAYDSVRHETERIGDDMPLKRNFGLEELEEQIAEDMSYLVDRVSPASTEKDPTATLRSHGLLR